MTRCERLVVPGGAWVVPGGAWVVPGGAGLVEPVGIEPTTFALQTRRSPS